MLIKLFNVFCRTYRFPDMSLGTDTASVNRPLLTPGELLDLRQQAYPLKTQSMADKDVLQRQHGGRRSGQKGQGMDYEDSRGYYPGDDLRHMNWRLTARTGQSYIKVFREERETTVSILLDRRYGMRFGTRKRLKVTQAMRVAALAAFFRHQQGMAVGGLLLNAGTHWLNPCQDEAGLYGMIHQFNRACPPNHEAPYTSLHQGLNALHNSLNKGSIVYLLSDFSDLDRSCEPLLCRLASEHQVFAIQVLDPVEIELPRLGKLSFHHPDSGSARQIDTQNLRVRTDYRQRTEILFEQQEETLSSAGIQYRRLRADTDSIDNIFRESV